MKKLFQKIKNLFNKIGTLNIILILVGLFFLWFNNQMIQMYNEKGSIPESYAITVVGAILGECGICGWIRTTKDRKQQRVWDKEDLSEHNNMKGE